MRKLKKEMQPELAYSFGPTANMVNAFSKTGKEKVWLGLRNYTDVEEETKMRLLVKKADLIVCCSRDIEKTVKIKYKFKNKLDTSRPVEDKFNEWFYPDNRENKWAREYIYGSELNFNLGTATKVNMILHGDGSTNIFVGDQKGDGLVPFNEYIKTYEPNALIT